MLIVVVFPAPLPPSRARVSFALMLNETFSTAKSLPKYLLMLETLRISSEGVACEAMAVFSLSFDGAASTM